MEATRLMQLLYYLTQAADTVTARELAEYTGVSERTVKKDLIEAGELAKKSGCILRSQRGKGYWIQVVDAEQFEQLEQQLNLSFSYYNYTQEYEERANQIVRILLVQEGWINLDQVAEQLYLSRSSLKKSMQDVREILRSFRLEIEVKPGYGVKVSGDEINIRFCMLELFLDHDYRSHTMIQNETYMSYFILPGVDIGKLRHDFLKILRESGTRIVDNNTHRLVRYFFLMYQRFLHGKRLYFEKEDICFLRELGEYTTARKILKHLEKEDTGIFVDEMEVLGVELLLLMWNDLNEGDEMAKRYPLFYRKSSLLADGIILRIKEQWGIDFKEMAGFRESLISAIIPNYTKIYFSFLGYNRTIGKRVETNMMSSSPVCLAMAMTVADVIEEQYGLVLSRADIFSYIVRFYIAISRIHYTYVPRKILISAQNGSQSCAIIRDRMVKRFGVNVFERLDFINAYEIRRINQEDYDYLILNFAPYYYRYDLPVIYVDSIPSERQMDQIYYQVILSGYQLRHLQAMLNFGEDFVFTDFPYEGREAFLNLICYKYCRERHIAEMKRYLERYTDICVWNGIAAIVTDSRYTGRNYFHLYCLDSPGVWEKKAIRYILFMSVNIFGEKKLIKYLEQLTHELVSSSENLEKLVSTKSMNQCYEIVKRELTLGQ